MPKPKPLSDGLKRIAKEEIVKRTPPPPEQLVGALHDRIHPTSGPLIKATPLPIPKRSKITK